MIRKRAPHSLTKAFPAVIPRYAYTYIPAMKYPLSGKFKKDSLKLCYMWITTHRAIHLSNYKVSAYFFFIIFLLAYVCMRDMIL